MYIISQVWKATLLKEYFANKIFHKKRRIRCLQSVKRRPRWSVKHKTEMTGFAPTAFAVTTQAASRETIAAALVDL